MPLAIRFAPVINNADSFMIIGGINSATNPRSNSDKIFKYIKNGGQWEVLNTILSVARASHTAINVKSSIFNGRIIQLYCIS